MHCYNARYVCPAVSDKMSKSGDYFLRYSLSLTGLIEQRKCAGSEEIVKERITKLQQQWEYLVQKSGEKSQHLKESNQQQQFNTNVKKLDFWLGEVRGLKYFSLEWLESGICTKVTVFVAALIFSMTKIWV